MAQIVTDKFLELYNDWSKPYMEVLKNIFYEGTTTLDLIAKKKIAELKKRNLLSDSKGSPFPTYTGYVHEQFLVNDRIATADAVTQGYWIEDGDEITTIEKDVGTSGKFYPANIGFAMRLTETEKQMLEDFKSSGKVPQLKEQIKSKWNMYIEDAKYSLARAWYRGLGGDTIDSTYNSAAGPFGISGWNWGTSTAKPNRRQLEGFYTYVMNPLVTTYGNVDTGTYPFWKPKVYDFNTGGTYTNAPGLTAGAIPFGYAIGNIDEESELMGTSNSSTANVPIIIDIIGRCIQKHTQNRKKPQLLVCRREWYDLIIRAKTSKAYNQGFDNDKLKTLMDMGYPEHTLIEGVPVIPDDTVYETQDGSRLYACPQNVILMVDLDSVKIMSNASNNFKQNGWEKIAGRYGVYHNYVSATILSYTNARHLQGIIRFYPLYQD
jgi:hypothetical protein